MSRVAALQSATPQRSSQMREVTKPDWCVAIVIGCALSLGVWLELLMGGGIVGGDTYPYFFPQKLVMADAFAHGELPLWHDRTGLGYPLHAESQAGVFYPTNQILYRLFDINTAYNASIMLHYALAFVFAWRFCRCQKLSQLSSLLAAMVFVYGWFPARLSLEWSIIGGVWFPCCLWLTDRLIRCQSRRAGCLLAIAFGTHLLAGHFTLAFITQLCCLGYAVLATTVGRVSRPVQIPVNTIGLTSHPVTALNAVAMVTGAISVGILLAAVQLIPTLELRQMSQRDGGHAVFNPMYGHMPPVYLSQLIASWWYWHSPEIVQSRQMLQFPFLMSPADTNQVEAHLSVGLIPLGLVFCLLQYSVRRRLQDTNWQIWILLSGIAVIYGFGWLVPVMKHLPGFGFFMGPARYTIITTMGLAIVAGLVLDSLLRRKSSSMQFAITALIAAITLPDLLASGDTPVCDAQIVPTPPIAGLPESWVAAEVAKDLGARLLAPGPNVGNLFGVSCVPQYLGLGPAEYFQDDASFDTIPVDADSEFPVNAEVLRMRDRGITHLLTQEAIAKLSRDLDLAAAAPDSFLNRVWARGNATCYLYRLTSATGRIVAEPKSALTSFTWVERRPSRQVFTVALSKNAVVTANELMFPGWQVKVDEADAVATSSRGFRRSVQVSAGQHTIEWTFRPRSFVLGAVVSGMMLIAVCVFGFSSRR